MNASEGSSNASADGKPDEGLVVYNKYSGGKLEESGENTRRNKKKSKQQLGREKYSTTFPDKPALPMKEVSGDEEAGARGKRGRQKFVPLFSGDSTAVAMLPGRHRCDCWATKHQLVSNCLGCGRVVCAQEGSGPCMVCADLVCTKEEREILNRGSRRSEQLEAHLLRQLPAEDARLAAAEEYKTRLLDYDRTSARRTQVIDDEMDYFQADSTTWLSPAEREALQAREEELRAVRHTRKPMKFSLDFAGRNVVLQEDLSRTEETSALDVLYGGAEARETGGGRRERQSAPAAFPERETPRSVDPSILTEPPTFVPSGARPAARKAEAARVADPRRQGLRNQDAELRELRDEGLCMSMHQPWASLLVRGIKRDEGRTWYSPHRGRLWIAATAKTPDPADVKEEEAHYRARGVPAEDFPTSYPPGCLLGCVDVVECLPQPDYREAYPDGESASPFVFVCTNHQELLVKFPIVGKHKIYHLDPQVHEASKKGLERAREL